MPGAPSDPLKLLDWKRRVLALYAEVRAHPGEATLIAFRAAKDALFATHPQSPVPASERSGFAGLDYFAHDAAMRVTAPLEPAPAGAIEIPTSVGPPMRFARIGQVRPVLAGTRIALSVYWLNAYGGSVFLPFRDALAGLETYGGGRYLLDTVKGADLGTTPDGELVLDFNYAYNPSCSYDAAWSCPLAPLENRLDIPIAAGERVRPAR